MTNRDPLYHPAAFLLKLLPTRYGFLSVLLLRLRVIEDMLAGPGSLSRTRRSACGQNNLVVPSLTTSFDPTTL
ncbi:hypothetical protein CFBP5507_24895 (plasmid) [Agrobacterium salinitolerans]|uniref:Uncharacterized protein n=1 Tax=Agrobacterium salinitolerans TaxID=1183413 RepID=A0A9X9KHM1_9HYPH|nr:hypothetical protein [Agrobacterium salinitolerans]UYZ11064.1 hypothetical protein CFBP5507_24895 [Agrobacterium salinitolerans]